VTSAYQTGDSPRDGFPAAPGQRTTATPALHTTEEAAAILRVRKSWLERKAAARKIPFTMLGGSYRFTSRHLSQIVQLFEIAPVTELQAPAARGGQRAAVRRRTAADSAPPLRPRPRSGPRRRAPETFSPDLPS